MGRISKYYKIRNFLKKARFHKRVPTLAWIVARRKMLDLKKSVFPLAFKKWPRSYPINARPVHTASGTSIRSNEAHESLMEKVFLFLLRLFFCFSLILFLVTYTCLLSIVWNTHKKIPKCNRVCRPLNCLKQSCAKADLSHRKWNFTSLIRPLNLWWPKSSASAFSGYR